MLATDNHIGYLERDPVRSHDAINTFEEILQLAVKNDASTALTLCYSVSQPLTHLSIGRLHTAGGRLVS